MDGGQAGGVLTAAGRHRTRRPGPAPVRLVGRLVGARRRGTAAADGAGHLGGLRRLRRPPPACRPRWWRRRPRRPRRRPAAPPAGRSPGRGCPSPGPASPGTGRPRPTPAGRTGRRRPTGPAGPSPRTGAWPGWRLSCPLTGLDRGHLLGEVTQPDLLVERPRLRAPASARRRGGRRPRRPCRRRSSAMTSPRSTVRAAVEPGPLGGERGRGRRQLGLGGVELRRWSGRRPPSPRRGPPAAVAIWASMAATWASPALIWPWAGGGRGRGRGGVPVGRRRGASVPAAGGADRSGEGVPAASSDQVTPPTQGDRRMWRAPGPTARAVPAPRPSSGSHRGHPGTVPSGEPADNGEIGRETAGHRGLSPGMDGWLPVGVGIGLRDGSVCPGTRVGPTGG